MGGLQGEEFTLCGDAFDIHIDEPELGKLKTVKAQPVTCPRCKEVILACRGVKVEGET
jgi:hypothetical protein